MVFEGKVIEKHSFWNSSGTRIYTANKIFVSKSFKGGAPEVIEVVTHGGSVDSIMHYLPHGIKFSIGEEGLFFCKYFSSSENATNDLFMLNGQSGVVYYEFGKNGYQAYDNKTVYSNYSRDIIKVIEETSNDPTVHYHSNGFEQQIEDWLESNLTMSFQNSVIIEFSFENIHTVGSSKIAFDVFTRTNTTGVRLASSEVFLQYDTAVFGTNIAQQEHIQVTEGAVLMDSVYALSLEDYTANTIRLSVSSSPQPLSLYAISPLWEKFVNVQIDIENLQELISFSFDDFSMAQKSSYYDGKTKRYVNFDRIDTSDPVNLFNPPMITGFFGEDPSKPEHITAGTGEVLTIEGTDFGTVKGRIEFFDADGSLLSNNKVETSATDIISWSEQKIETTVPSAEASGDEHTAGTGTFSVVLAGTSPMMVTSSDPVRVDYSVENFRTSAIESFPVYLGDGTRGDGNANGQLVFTMSSNMTPAADIRSIIEQSLCDWNAQAGINWVLAPASGVTPSTAANLDGVNLIYFGSESEFQGEFADLSARTILEITNNTDRRENCQLASNPSLQLETDIVFRQSANLSNANPNATGGWHYANLSSPPSPSPNQLDFYSTLLHELGHAHLLRHTRENNKMMYRGSGATLGAAQTSFAPEDKAGAEFILKATKEVTDNSICPNGVVPVDIMGLCGNVITQQKEAETSDLEFEHYIDGKEIVFKQIAHNKSGSYLLTVYTATGQQVFSSTFDWYDSQEEIRVSLDPLKSSGIYFFSLANLSSSEYLTGKLVYTQW